VVRDNRVYFELDTWTPLSHSNSQSLISGKAFYRMDHRPATLGNDLPEGTVKA